MALFRKFFYRKPPDGLLEISERVYVFDCCFTTDILEDEEYKVYMGGIVGQLRDHLPDASFMVFNFREGENQSQIDNILSEYDMTVIDYPRQYEGCPLLTMEMIHHFLKSSESWLSLGQQNVLLMHCERGGWPVLAFMLAALLIFRKQFTGEQKTLDMIYKQAPRELLQLMCPLNPLPSQLRYLQYVSRRNVGSGWPPLDRALTLDCIILRLIPSLDGEGGCRPIFRIYGQDPLMVADRTPKVLFSTPKRSKFVRHYKQADCALVKIDIHCHIQGDVVLECISLDSDQEREEMMFRVMFNTAFIRSNILMLNRDDIDILWNSKDQFPKDFRAEVLFSEMDATTSFASIDLPGMEEKDGLPVEAFARVQEIFSNVDWLDPRSDVALNVLQHITASNRPQENLEMSSPDTAGTGNNMVASALAKFEEKPKPKAAVNNIKIPTFTIQGKQPTPLFIPSPKENEIQKNNEPQESQVALQRPAQSKIISQRSSFSSPVSFNNPLQGSPMPITRYHSAPSLLGITALLHDHDVSNNEDTLHQVTRSPPTPVTASPSVTSLQKPLQLNHTVSTPLPLPPSLPPSLQSLVEAHKTVKRISVSPTPPPLPPKSSLKLIQSSVTQLTATTSDGGELSLSALSPTPPVPSTSEVFTSSSALQSSIDSHITTQITHITPLPQHTLAPTESLLARPLETISLARDQSLSTSFPPPQLLSPSEASTVSTKRLHSSTPPPPPPPPRFDAPPSAMVDNLLSTPPPLMATSSPSSNNLFSSPPPPPPPPPSFSGSSPSSAPCSLLSMPTKSSVVPLEPPPPHLPSRSPNNMSSVPPPPPSLPRCGPPLSPLPPLNFGVSSCTSSAPPPPPPPPPSMPTPGPPPPPPPPPSMPTPGPPPPPPPPNMPTPGPPPPPPPTMAKPGPPPPPPPPLNSRSSVNTSLAPPPPPPPCLAPKNNLGSDSSHAPPVPPPPAPFAKGLSSSKDGGASLPSQSGRSNGSIPPIPGPPSGSPFSARGSGLSRTRNQSLPKKTNLKPYHWLKLTRAMQGSLWAETQKPEEASKAPEFDMSELESLFSAAAPNSDHGGKDGKSSRRSAGPKVEKVQLIELRRAYNCEIMLSKIKIPLPDLMSLVLALDDSALDVDQVDNLIKFCPTKEEIETLKGYKGDKEKLGKCELFFLELMKVPRVESKLRVFSFKMQFHSQVSDLRKNLNIVNSASEEVRNSVKLKRIMQTILSLGNALNHGTARGSAVGFRLDSLLKLTDTRARNNKMTLMHYLCKVLAEKLPELLDFPQDLASLEAATKIQLKYLAEEMQAISKGLEKVVQELTASENDGPISEYFCKTLKEFLAFAEGEVRSLALLYSNVGRNADALALYFGEDPARCPFEQVVSTLLNFVRMFVRAHQENCKQVELEKKKALKEAENEKLKTAASERNTNSISIK